MTPGRCSSRPIPTSTTSSTAAAWADTLPRFAKRPAALDAGRYQRFSEFMKDAGLIKTVKPEDYAVDCADSQKQNRAESDRSGAVA